MMIYPVFNIIQDNLFKSFFDRINHEEKGWHQAAILNFKMINYHFSVTIPDQLERTTLIILEKSEF